ncbi:MAG: hypothetical protein AUG80_16420, partial [Candidatus Rokubacteria bacterium 13_1_20CM_4_68_9]
MLVAGLVVVVTARAGDGAGPQPGGDVFTAIVGTILAGPVPAVHGTDGRHHVVYELVLTNTEAVPATLQAVEVRNRANDARLARFEGDQLLGMLRAMNARPAASLELPANESRVVLLSIAFSSVETVPRLLDHRLDALAAISPAATAPSPISYRLAPLEVPARAAPVLRPPLEGKGWLVVNGCCDGTGAHRGAILANVRSWVGYGAIVRAAAAGRVVASRNDLSDQIPGSRPDPHTITVDNVDGNFVVLDHGGGIYTFYAHFQPKSVKVVRGDRVEAGQELGRLGNTGNTSGPHL